MWPGEFVYKYALLVLTGGDAGWAQRVYYLTLLPLAALTMRFLLGHFIGSKLVVGAVSLMYALNGLTIGWFLGGGQAYLPVHVMFPLIMAYLLRVLSKRTPKALDLLLFILALALITSTHPHMLFYFAPFVVIFGYRKLEDLVTLRQRLTLLSSLALTVVALFFLAAPFTIYQFQDLVSRVFNPGEGVGAFSVTPVSVFLEDMKALYFNPYLNTMVAYYTGTIFFIGLFGFALLDRSRLKVFIPFFLISSGILIFIFLIKLGFLDGLFKQLPLLLVFRSPSKLAFMLIWAIFPMIALLLDAIFERLKDGGKRLFSPAQQWSFRAGLLALTATGSVLFLIGDFHPNMDKPQANFATFFSSNLLTDEDIGEVPPHLEEIRDWITLKRDEEGTFRTLWLPNDRHQQKKVSWIYDGSVDGGPEPDHMGLLFNALIRDENRSWGKLLAGYNIKYLVVNKTPWAYSAMQQSYEGLPRLALQQNYGWYPFGDPKAYQNLLEGQDDIEIAFETSFYSIYENKSPMAEISAYSRTFLLAPTAEMFSSGPHTILIERRIDELITNGVFSPEGAGLQPDSSVGTSYESLIIDGALIPTDEERIEYSKLSDATIFLGDVSASIHPESRSWIDDAETLLFVYDAPSSLQPLADTPVAPVSERTPRDTHIVPLDDPRFWTASASGTGSIGFLAPSYPNPEASRTVEFGAGPGTAANTFIYHRFGKPQDWSAGTSLAFEWTGQGTGSQLSIVIATMVDGESPDYFQFIMDDDFKGLKNVSIPLERFSRYGFPSWDTIQYLEFTVIAPATRNSWAIGNLKLESLKQQSLLPDWNADTSMTFEAPRDGFYTFSLTGRFADAPAITLDSHILRGALGSTFENGSGNYETESLFLTSGRHRLTLLASSTELTLTEILVLASSTPTSFAQAIYPRPISIHLSRKQHSSASVSIDSDGPFFLVHRTSFDEDWEASSSSGRLFHIPAGPLGWANGFYVPDGGTQEIIIEFTRQKTRNIVVGVWAAAWAVLIGALVYLTRDSAKRIAKIQWHRICVASRFFQRAGDIPAAPVHEEPITSGFLRTKETKLFAGILFVIAVLLARGLLTGPPFILADLVPFHQDYANLWTRFVYAWWEGLFGRVNPANPGIFLLEGLFGILTAGNEGLAQRLSYLMLLPTASIGMYLLLGRIVRWRAARLLFALLYVVNGITLTYFLTGSIPMLIPLAGFPFAALYFIRMLRDGQNRLRYFVLFTAITGLVSSYLIYAILMFAPFIVALLLAQAVVDIRRLLKVLPWLISSLVVLFLLVAPTGFDQILSLTRFFGGARDSVGLYSATPLAEVLAEMQRVYAHPITGRAFTHLAFIGGSLALIATVLLRKTPQFGAIIALALITLSMVGFWKLTGLGVLQEALASFPPLLAFKDPQKLLIMGLWAVILMSALAADGLKERWNRYSGRAQVRPLSQHLGALALFGLTVWTALFVLVGDAHAPLDNPRENLNQALLNGWNPSKYDGGDIPQGYLDGAEWLHERREKEGVFRSLWLPTAQRLQEAILPMYDPRGYGSPVASDLSPLTFLPLSSGQTKRFGTVISHLNIKYLLINTSPWESTQMKAFSEGPVETAAFASYTGSTGWGITGSPDDLILLLDQQIDLRRAATTSSFVAYENLRYLPTVSAYNKVFTVLPLQVPSINDHFATLPNLLVAAGFETTLDNWKTHDYPSTLYEVDDQVAQSGLSSLRMEMTKEGSHRASVQQMIPVNQDQDMYYAIRVWVQTNNHNGVVFQLSAFDSKGEEILWRNGASATELIPRTTAVESGWTEKTIGPIRFPEGSQEFSLEIMAASHDIVDFSRPGVVWLDKVAVVSYASDNSPVSKLLVEGGHRDYSYGVNGALLEVVPALLENVPYVAAPQHLLRYGNFIAPDFPLDDMMNHASAVILVGDSAFDPNAQSGLTSSLPHLFVHETETTTLFTGSDDAVPTSVAHGSLSGGRGISVAAGEHVKHAFVAHRAGEYEFLIRASSEIGLRIAGINIPLSRHSTADASARWHRSPRIHFMKGQQISLEVFAVANSAVLDQFLVYSAAFEQTQSGELTSGPSFDETFKPVPLNVQTERQSPVSHSARINSLLPVLLVFGENYHQDWVATGDDGKQLEHFREHPLGWANGYWVAEGEEQEVHITFQRQGIRNWALLVWLLAWLGLAGALPARSLWRSMVNRRSKGRTAS